MVGICVFYSCTHQIMLANDLNVKAFSEIWSKVIKVKVNMVDRMFAFLFCKKS
jgi:hypothetical protein